MSIRILAALFLCLSFVHAQEAQQTKPDQRCTIEGTVTSLKTGKPLSKAELHLEKNSASSPSGGFETTSDASGHYVLDDLDPGIYTLRVERNGYVNTNWNTDPKKHTPTPITLTAGQHLSLTINLPSQAVVTGLVVDEGNEPMSGVSVSLLSAAYKNGKRTIQPAAGASTNDKGEYRIFGVAPGRYWVRASASREFIMQGEVRGPKSQTSYIDTYFPGVMTASEGTQLRLTAGSETDGIDFHMTKGKSFSITGQLVNAGSKQHFIQLRPFDASGMPTWEGTKMAIPDADGKFAFHGCLPGHFSIFSRAMSMGGEPGGGAHTDVFLTDKDLSVTLEITQNPDLQGSIRSDDPNETLKPGMRIFLAPEADGGMMGGGAAEVKDDGTFTLKSVSLDRARLALFPIPDGHYIKSIQLGNIETQDTALDFSNGIPNEMVVILSAKGATITGTIQDDNQKAITNATVVLVPDDRKLQSRYEHVSPDQNGQFTLKNVAPGTYKLFAFDNAEDGSWLDTEWLRPFETKGESIELKESDKITKTLTVIPTDTQ